MASEYDPPVYGVDSLDDEGEEEDNDTSSSLAIIPAVDLPPPKPIDDSRRVLFQRLWTDEDEIELLNGFADYTSQRGGVYSSSHHHDTAPFYENIKTKLQLEFNKNQLVEKLRRLKKKYRNIMAKIESGKEYSFKTPHEKATFEISRKIWYRKDHEIGYPGFGFGSNDHDRRVDLNLKGFVKTKKRSRPEENQPVPLFNPQVNNQDSANLVPGLIEETVKSCLTPVLKELVNCATGNSNPVGFSFGNSSPMGYLFGGDNHMGNVNLMDDKWRKQYLMELEVYSKRLELVQDQIKSRIEDLTKGL